MKKLLLGTVLLLAIYSVALLAFQTPKNTVYRDVEPHEACNEIALENNDELEIDESISRCFFQTHVIPASTWPDIKDADDQPNKIRFPDQYHLAFVELEERSGSFSKDNQLAYLTSVLRSHNQNFVVVYIHGWRHNAKVGNENVRKFRTMLAYSRAALNTRCIELEQYCEASVTGVYVGWRGASVLEPQDKNRSKLWSLWAGPTLISRKRLSEAFALKQSDVLTNLFSSLNTALKRDVDLPFPTRDKLLVVGHSLGGNMLVTYAEPLVRRLIETRTDNSAHAELFIGDLTVLINPAAEASKWAKIQTAERAKADLENSSWIAFADSDPDSTKTKIKNWNRLYPFDQRPLLIAVTATGNWHKQELEGIENPYLDGATAKIFPIYGWFKCVIFPSIDCTAENTKTIGHLHPTYASKTRLNSLPIGTSHEFIGNETQKVGGRAVPTSILAAADPERSWCKPAKGWLYDARNETRTNVSGQRTGDGVNWDWDTPGNVSNSNGGTSVQYRQGLYLEDQRNRRSVSSPRSPFWNVRSLNTIDNHNGFVGYPFWCSINQIVLDDISANLN